MGAVFAALAFVAAAISLFFQWQDRQIRLQVVEEPWSGADNTQSLPRFLIHNVGSRPLDVRGIMVDTLPNVTDDDGRVGTAATSMEVEEGKMPGWLRPGDTLRLNTHRAAQEVLNNGLSEEVKTDVIVKDPLGKERRYPVILKIEGPDNEGQFDF